MPAVDRRNQLGLGFGITVAFCRREVMQVPIAAVADDEEWDDMRPRRPFDALAVMNMGVVTLRCLLVAVGDVSRVRRAITARVLC